MSQHSTPYAVPAVGMRKVMICPVCKCAFLGTPQHRWIAYIPRIHAEKPVCSYHCMRAMERKLGRWRSVEIVEEQEQPAQVIAQPQPEQGNMSALLHRKQELEAQLAPLMAEVNRLYDTRRMSKIDDYKRGNLFTQEKELMTQLGQVNRQIREVQRREY